MDIVGIISKAIADAIGVLLSGLVLQGVVIATVLYDGYIAGNLLPPGVMFPSLSMNSLSGGEGGIFSFVMFNIYDPLLSAILLALGLLYILNSSLELKYNLKHAWLKILLTLLLSNIAFFLSQDLLTAGGIIYTAIYNYGGSNHNFHEGINFLSKISLGPNPNTTVSILVLSVLFFLLLFMMITLSVRLAILYTFPILIPFFTLFLILPQTRDIGIRIWWLFIDAVFSPILMGIPLILATYSNNSSLILGFIALSDSIPFILMKEPSFLGNLGLLFGMSAESAARRTIPAIRNMSIDAKGVLTSISTNTRLSQKILMRGSNAQNMQVRNYSPRYSRPPNNNLYFRVRP